MVAHILDTTGTDPAALCLEVTESVFVEDAGNPLHALEALKRMGVTLAIDDFGTGFASFNYLKRLPVDVVKVARTFVDGLGRDPEDSVIVGATVRMAHPLGLTVVAEGVETQRQLDEVRAVGCDYAQGYHLAPPR